jgi:hypothetical protein
MLCCRLLALHGAANFDESATRTGDRATNEEEIAIPIDPDDLEVLMGRAIDPEVAGTATAPVRVPGIRVAVGGRLTMDHRAVTRAAAAKVMPLDAAGEAVPLRNADHVDTFTELESIDPDERALLNPFDVSTELADAARGRDPGASEVTDGRLGKTPPLHLAKTQCNGLIAIRGNRFPLDDKAWTRFNHGDRENAPVLSKNARHPDLPTDNVFHILI